MKRSTSNCCIKSTDIYNFCSLLTIHLDIQSPGSEVTSTILLSINSGAKLPNSIVLAHGTRHTMYIVFVSAKQIYCYRKRTVC